MGIFNFLKNKELEDLKEMPLGYWEEKSYMIAILNKIEEWTPELIVERINKINGLEVLENNFVANERTLKVKLKYEDDIYDVGIIPCPFNIIEFYLNNIFYFSEEEKEKIRSAHMGMTISMSFLSDIKKSFHLQIKLAVAIAPDLLGLVDESAERVLPARWVKLAASSLIPPGPNDIVNVQAVTGKEEVWLHTHGLLRCGITELEILKSDRNNFSNHCNLLMSYASFLIDKKDDLDPRESFYYIGILENHNPILVTCRSWTLALKEYDNLKIGGLSDRKNGHNTKTSPIFIYKNEEDANNKKIDKVSIYNDMWGKNPIYFISDAETDRMSKLARERFDYLKKVNHEDGTMLLAKVALKVNDGKDLEHIWFEILEFKDNKFKARLTQEPYGKSNVKTGDEVWLTKDEVTDWEIYTNKFKINPGNVYLLEEIENEGK